MRSDSHQTPISRGISAALLAAQLASIAALTVLTGCGYALVGRASNIPEDVKAVYVHAMENRTARSQVEQILSRALIDELVTRQRFTIVNSQAEADAEILGTVAKFTSVPVGFEADGRAREYELSIVAEFVFQRIPTEEEEPEILWSADRYQFRESYAIQTGETGSEYFDPEDESIEEVAERFAETVVSDLLEGF